MEKVLLRELREKVLEIGNLLPVYDLVWMAGGTACARDTETGYIACGISGQIQHTLIQRNRAQVAN